MPDRYRLRARQGTKGDQRGLRVAFGFSTLELIVVVVIALVVAAIAFPNFVTAYYNMRLKATAGDLAGLMQQGRITASRQNRICQILYWTNGSLQEAYVDQDVPLNNSWDTGEPLIPFLRGVRPAAGAPTGSGGQPPPYVLIGDTGSGAYDNTKTLAFTARGLPCNYDTGTSPPTCTTPAAKYFTYYLTDNRPGTPGWAAVVVTKSGRTKVVLWNGAGWQ